MKTDLTWLVGRRLKDVEKRDCSWFFVLDDGNTIATESVWRLITPQRIVVTSEDEGQSFGLTVPVNAAQRMKDSLGQSKIVRFELKEPTSDLLLHFSNDQIIEFLNLSCGYEGWRMTHGSQEIICMGGGGLTELVLKT
jgi:hypothetical protein